MIQYPPVAFHLGSVVPVGIRGDLSPPAAEELLIEGRGGASVRGENGHAFCESKGDSVPVQWNEFIPGLPAWLHLL